MWEKYCSSGDSPMMALATACAPGMLSRVTSICSSSVGLRLTNQLRGAARMPCTLKKSIMS